jgi:hypothetical protein
MRPEEAVTKVTVVHTNAEMPAGRQVFLVQLLCELGSSLPVP